MAAILTAILDDVTGPQQPRNPEYIKGFLPKANSHRTIETQQKPMGGVPSTPPPPLYHGGAVTLCTSEGN